MIYYNNIILTKLFILCTRRRTANDFSAVPAANFELLAILWATTADRPPAAAVVGRSLSTAYPLLAIPVATHIASAPTARTTYHAGHATADATPAARGHVQSHTLCVRGRSIIYYYLMCLYIGHNSSSYLYY